MSDKVDEKAADSKQKAGPKKVKTKGKPKPQPKVGEGPLPRVKPDAELAPPSRLQENRSKQPSVKTTEESLANESVFEPDCGFHSAQREIDFTPSATGWTDLIDQTYAELRNDKGILVSKDMPIEALRYYASCVFWLRAISLKLWLGRDLTDAEVAIQRAFEGKSLVLPEPIFLAIKAIGRTKTKNGETLSPVLPDVPTTVTADIPGGLGIITAANHNVYEELPVVGPTYQGCYERSLTTNAGVYASVFAPVDTTASRNLQGFRPLVTCRQDSLALLASMGFEGQGIQPRSISNSGINFNAVKTVSNLLSRITAFKIVETDIFSIPATGSIAQIIEAIPDQTGVDQQQLAYEADVALQCYSNESKSHIGISMFVGLNQYKSIGLQNDITSWSCITFTDAAPVPADFIANRNDRRNLPNRFSDRVFYTAVQNVRDLRTIVISKLAKHKT